MPPLNTFDKTIIALALTNSIAVPVSQAATINVDGTCTLQDAIRSANTNALVAGSGCEAGDVGADIIDIPTQTITLNSAEPDGEQDGPSGLPLVQSNITIQGNGSTIERDSNADDFRIIAMYNNEGSLNGGSASLTLDSITLIGGRAVYEGYGAGGAIFVGYAFDTGSTSLTLNNTTITGNYSDGDGGGVFAASGTTVEINNSSLTANSAVYSGGGVYADQVSSLTISSSTIDNNTADSAGGGVWIDFSENFTIKNTTLSNNNVLSGGYSGGAVAAYNIADIQIVNSTISTNSAPVSGSGLYLYASTMVMTNSTVANNLGLSSIYFVGFNSSDFANSATFVNSVIANTQGLGCIEGSYSTLTTADSNWFQDASCDGVADGDPMLGLLSSNGGITLTHEPQSGSGLVDNANPSRCPSADQRGELRDVGDDNFFLPIRAINGNVVVINLGGIVGECDIGSVETPDPV